MKCRLLAFLLLALVTRATAADDLATASVEKLIDDLTQIDSQAAGLHGTASVGGFIGEDKPLRFEGGVLGSPPPETAPQMRELVRRGVPVLPQLISHLTDRRETKLIMGKNFHFAFRYFADEYDAKKRPKEPPIIRAKLKRDFDGEYTVRVGDVCYAIIGQIVNRWLLPVRYQPTGGLIINSPLEAPELVELVKRDWGDVDAPAHKASLIAEAKSNIPGNHVFYFGSALERLRFYYPEDYKRLKVSDLKKRITEFEHSEKAQR